MPERPWVSSPRYLLLGFGSSQRAISSRAISNPMLWRVRSYSAPGFPRPMINQSAGAPLRRTAGYSPPESSSPPAWASASSPVAPDAGQVDVDGVARDRMARELLEHDRRRVLTVDGQVEDGTGVRESDAQDASLDLEGNGLRAAAVHDPRHHPLAPQPSGRARA